jgi:hypothetical protein
MKTIAPAALSALLLLSAPFSSKGRADPPVVEASFDSARFADDLSGTYSGAPGSEIHVSLYASAGSTVNVNLAPEPTTAAPIPGLTLTLSDPAGVDQNVTGSKYDKTKPGATTIVWSKVPLATTGSYLFVLRGTGAGTWRLKIKGTIKKIAETFHSTTDLAVAAESYVDFDGLRGGTVSYSLAPVGSSKFVGSLTRIVRPDGSTIDASVPDPGVDGAKKGKVPLDVDGVHRLYFKNIGLGIGAWTATTTVSPPTIFSRRGFVSGAGTAFVPVVTKVTPSSDYHLDDLSEVTLTGRDFQSGADVRLVRKNFDDIIATDVHVDSETQIRCMLNLDTAPVTGEFSTGQWNVGVWNAPVYLTPGDPKTLDKSSPSNSRKKTFSCVSASAITLPHGVIKETETWQLAFNSDFQTDLNHMGLGSTDVVTAQSANSAVQAYVVCFLRDLMLSNETTGKLTAGVSVPISFVVGKVPSPAGKPGRDYDRIEIGGAWQTGDPTDPTEPLLWGFAPLGQHPVDLSINVDDGAGGTTRAGYGVRTDVLNRASPVANSDWVLATAPLSQTPLTALDRQFFAPGFRPTTVGDANRYRDIVNQITRVSREIAALIAHQIGRSMGLAPGGQGPMQNPATAGYMWPTTAGLSFVQSDVSLLLANATTATLPGNSATLKVTYFPLLATQPSILPDSTAAVPYAVNWSFVGGRANALETDYSVKLLSTMPVLGGIPLQGTATATIQGLTVTASPVYIDMSAGLPYGGIAYLRLQVTDTVRNGTIVLFYRLNVQPNFAQLPSSGIVFNRAVQLQQYIANN